MPATPIWPGPRALPLGPLPACGRGAGVGSLRLLCKDSKSKADRRTRTAVKSRDEQTPYGGIARVRCKNLYSQPLDAV